MFIFAGGVDPLEGVPSHLNTNRIVSGYIHSRISKTHNLIDVSQHGLPVAKKMYIIYESQKVEICNAPAFVLHIQLIRELQLIPPVEDLRK